MHLPQKSQIGKTIRSLGGSEYSVPASGPMPKSREQLEARFVGGCVADVFYQDVPWTLHELCKYVDQRSTDQIMLLKQFDRRTYAENAIVQMGAFGYRPGTHLDAFALAMSDLDLQKLFSIIALGSTIERAGDIQAAFLSSDKSGRRSFSTRSLAVPLPPEFRVLFVRN